MDTCIKTKRNKTSSMQEKNSQTLEKLVQECYKTKKKQNQKNAKR